MVVVVVVTVTVTVTVVDVQGSSVLYNTDSRFLFFGLQVTAEMSRFTTGLGTLGLSPVELKNNHDISLFLADG